LNSPLGNTTRVWDRPLARALSAWQKHVKTVAKKTGKSGATLFRAASKTYTKKGTPKTRAKRSNPTKVKKTTRKPKLFKTISGIGALEDLGVGLFGGILFRLWGQGANAVPAMRIVQGIAGVAFDRRGKRHLVQGVIDYVDNWLLEKMGYGVGVSPVTTFSIDNLLTPLKALKIVR
ncbi:unnamed protein product, partial [marine sediment metagenome]